MRGSRGFEWLPAGLTVLAAAMFVAVVIAFACEVFSFRDAVETWARRDLRSQAELAAENLVEPLRTQDFRRIREFSDQLKVKGLELAITSVHGGRIFIAHGAEGLFGRGAGAPVIGESAERGEYVISVMTPLERVLEPYFRSLNGLGLAILVGALGVFLFFFVTYRQRVRIRELAKLEKFRREFIADVSHEIKTPLSGILGAVDLLGEVKVEGEGEQRNVLVSLIKKESKRLNGLVQSILDLARLEREGDVLNLQEVDLGEVVHEIAAKYPCVCTVKSSGAVRCDPQLIEQAVSNLIGNAVRHSGSEEILVTVACDGKMARVVVEDHGVGIPPEHASRIFERFHRVDPARASETGGAGLGLAIVRRIARLHGGDVEFLSVQPHGSRFTLSFLRK